MFDVFAVLLQNPFDTTSPSLIRDACETFRHASLHIKSPTSTKFPAAPADRAQPPSSHLLIHSAVDFIQQPLQPGSVQYLMLNSHRKQNLSCGLDGATLFREFDEFTFNRRVENKTMLKFAKYHANWFRRFHDVSSKT